jgi:hypothetical protein
VNVQALYVDPARGPYAALLGAENCWGVERDAKMYGGPGPVVAHPPCGPWGKLRWNCRHQDPTCGPVAVAQVRAYGGVLEHPDGSMLWRHCGLPRPSSSVPMIAGREWSLAVDQCAWGHLARKRTWLFFVGISPANIPPLPPPGVPTMTIGTSRNARRGKKCLPKTLRHITPPLFAEWLVRSLEAA